MQRPAPALARARRLVASPALTLILCMGSLGSVSRPASAQGVLRTNFAFVNAQPCGPQSQILFGPTDIDLRAIDADGGEAIQRITVSVNGAQEDGTQEYFTARVRLHIKAWGTTTITFFATDTNGMEELPQQRTVTLVPDKPPITVAEFPPGTGQDLDVYVDPVTVVLTSRTPGACGAAGIHYSIQRDDGQEVESGTTQDGPQVTIRVPPREPFPGSYTLTAQGRSGPGTWEAVRVMGHFTIVGRPGLSSLALSPSTVPGGTASVGTVTLSAPAPAAGAAVMLASNSDHTIVPRSVLIPGGASSQSFPIATTPVSSTTAAALTAAWNGVTLQARLVLEPGLSAIVPAAVTLWGGQTQQFSASPGIAVAWAVEGEGTIDSNGLYTAPLSLSLSHSATVIATDSSNRQSRATVTLVQGCKDGYRVGDLTGDCKVDLADLRVLIEDLLNDATRPEEDFLHTGRVDGRDLKYLIDLILGQ